jgi:alpha,alpha-trehalase
MNATDSCAKSATDCRSRFLTTDHESPEYAMLDYTAMFAYIDSYWEALTRENTEDVGTLIGLPRPYVVPGVGAMFQEMYYWDSYFTALGLVGSHHHHLVVDMTENMAWLLERFGVIPNASRYYFLSRSQPPFFTQMVDLALGVKRLRGDSDLDNWLKRMLTLAETEHETVWHGTKQPHHRLVHAGLSRYFDINFLDMLASCESGWDHSTRCDDRWLSFLPVDLNSILYAREIKMAEFAALLGQDVRATAWRERARTRAESMRAIFWSDDQEIFLDFDYVAGVHDPTPTLAGFYPLWAEIATPAQAERLVARWLPQFEQAGGLVTSLTAQAGRQWAWPNGWAPLQQIVTEGLQRYGYVDDAQRLREKWLDMCATLHAKTGVLWEKYNVVNPEEEGEAGLYGHVTGFGWTNGVAVEFVRRLDE